MRRRAQWDAPKEPDPIFFLSRYFRPTRRSSLCEELSAIRVEDAAPRCRECATTRRTPLWPLDHWRGLRSSYVSVARIMRADPQSAPPPGITNARPDRQRPAMDGEAADRRSLSRFSAFVDVHYEGPYWTKVL